MFCSGCCSPSLDNFAAFAILFIQELPNSKPLLFKLIPTRPLPRCSHLSLLQQRRPFAASCSKERVAGGVRAGEQRALQRPPPCALLTRSSSSFVVRGSSAASSSHRPPKSCAASSRAIHCASAAPATLLPPQRCRLTRAPPDSLWAATALSGCFPHSHADSQSNFENVHSSPTP